MILTQDSKWATYTTDFRIEEILIPFFFPQQTLKSHFHPVLMKPSRLRCPSSHGATAIQALR